MAISKKKIKPAMLRVITYGTGKAVKIRESTMVCGYCHSGRIYILKKGNQIFCRECGKVSNITKFIEKEMD